MSLSVSDIIFEYRIPLKESPTLSANMFLSPDLIRDNSLCISGDSESLSFIVIIVFPFGKFRIQNQKLQLLNF
jgi:hypothetical protein